MKKVILTLMFFVMLTGVKSQIVQITNETFESTLSGWTIVPSTSWKADTNLYVSGHTSYRGYVPISNNPGDTTILTSPMYNLSSYGYVWLSFDQICKVSASDICQIEYKQNYMGAVWQPIPTSSYKGSGIYTGARFSHGSYTIWQPGDSLAQPTNSWWKTENFDISSEVSFAQVQFRFKITRGTAIGSYFVYGWLIDNFKIMASVNPIIPPVVELITNYSDTVYNTGPFVVDAKVATRSAVGIMVPKLVYAKTYNNTTTYDTVNMTAITGDSIWRATIPQTIFGTKISFTIIGKDSNGNTNSVYDQFFIKRPPTGGITGNVIIGTGTLTNYYTPASLYFKYSWARMLYLGTEINANNKGGLITKLAWNYNNSTGGNYSNQTCYFKMVDDTALTSGYLEPITDGATQVWTGTLNIVQGWNEIILDNPFYLPPGKNLEIYWHHQNGAFLGSSYYWNHTTTSPIYKTVYAQLDASFPSSNTGTLHYERPNVRLYLLYGIYDSNSVSLVSIDNPKESTISGIQNVKVTLKNKGLKYLDSCTINWKVNGVLQTPKVWKGHLLEDKSDTITIGSYNQRLLAFDTVDVWVSLPNGIIDTNMYDDSLRKIAYGCSGSISGTYIVGSNTGADIPSISAGLFIASNCGVSGNITLKLQNGVYNENWNFTNLSNIMGNYSLTITSLSGNKDSVILRPSSGDALTLNKLSNLNINNITIDAKNGNYAINFTGLTSNIVIENCTILASTTATTTAYGCVYKNTGTGLLDGLSIRKCKIDGGYSGIYLYGTSTEYVKGVTLDSNIVANQYYYGIYNYYVNSISTSYNTVTPRSTSAGTTWYGIYLNNNKNGGNIIGNRIYANNTAISSTLYGMRTYTIDSALVANNEIYLNSTASTTYGLYIDYPIATEYINNTILITGTGSSMRALYWYTYSNNTYDATMKNNIFMVKGGTTPYAINLAGSFTSSYAQNYRIDYNNYYSSGSLGYFSAAQATLANWKSVVSNDVNSTNILPDFIDSTINLKLINYLSFTCPKNSKLGFDINGELRDSLTCKGCHTLPVYKNDGGLIDFLGFSSATSTGSYPIKVIIYNYGKDSISSATITGKLNNVSFAPINYTPSKPLAHGLYDTLSLGLLTFVTGTNTISAEITIATDTVHLNDSLKSSRNMCPYIMGGEYIVGSSPTANYPTIDSIFVDILKCGIVSNITLKMESGTYTGSRDLSNLSNIIGNYTLTITSLAKDKDSVIFKNTSGVLLTLNNTRNLNINNITLNAVSGTYAVNFTGTASNIVIENCNIFASTTATTTSYGCVYKTTSTGLLDGLSIKKCKIDGGYYGIYLYGTSSEYAKRVTLDSNIITNQYYYGIYNYYVKSISTSYNTVSPRSTGAGTTWYGINLYYNKNGGNVIGNRVYSNNSSITSTLYGMRTYYIDSALVANNEIYLNSAASTTYGLYIDYPISMEYYHNSVLITGTGSSLRALYWYAYSNTTYDASMKNNIFTVNGGTTPYAIYLTGSYSSTYAQNYRFDYNNYYSSGNIGYVGSAQSTLANWQSVVANDINSTNILPDFIDSTLNLKLFNYTSFQCPKYTKVANDIEGTLRGVLTVKGCYSPAMQGADAGLVQLVNFKSTAYIGDSSNLEIVLMNMGATIITSATINWKFNGVSQSSVVWSGNLSTNSRDTISLGKIFYQSGTNSIIAWIDDLGSLNDTTHNNDTIKTSNYTCDSMLNGNYIIGATGNFVSMDAAVSALTKCGIKGPVTFAFQSGTYYQNTTIGYVNGTSTTNTVTFTSLSGDSSSVVLQRADDASTSLAPIMITNGENIIIQKLTLSGISPLTSTYTYSHGIIINGTSKNIVVRNCYLFVPKNFSTAVTGTNQNPVRILNNTVNNVNVYDNLIEGGSCGVYIYGSSSSLRITNVKIKNNIIRVVDTYGIYSYYADSIKMEKNIIEQRTGNFTPGIMYGIYNYYSNSDIIANKIHAASIYYGIYTYYMNDASARPALIINNEIIGDLTTTSHRGMYLNSYTNAKVYHNSILVGGSIAGYGLYVTSSASTTVDIKNNIIILKTTANGYPIYLASTTYIGTTWLLDYNDYYNVNGTNIGYAGAAITSLSNWKSTVTCDTHSVNVSPNFLDISQSLFVLDSNGISCPQINTVLTDIQDSIRGAKTTMGAYHKVPAKLDAMPSAFIALPSLVAVGVNTPLKIVVTNKGVDTLHSLKIGFSVNAISGTPYNWVGTIKSGDTSWITIGNFVSFSKINKIVVYTYLPNGSTDLFVQNDTIKTEIYGCDSSLRGTYTIGNTGDYSTIENAIKAIKYCGISGSVIFNIQSGTYTDGLVIDSIPGTNDTVTITFTSDTKNASDVTLDVSNTALRLTNTAHLNFEYITIYGSVIAVDFIGTCKDIKFYNCIIATYNASTSSTYRAVNYANTSGSGYYLKNVRFIKNIISGGYYNMYLYYPGSSSTDMVNCSITIDSNTLIGAYYSGIYSYEYSKYNSISYNTITTRNEATTQYGIYFNDDNTVGQVIGNKIVINSTSTGYGLYLYYLNYYETVNKTLISNNTVVIPQASTAYGIYCYYPRVLLYHNTVSLYGSTTSYGLYFSSMSSSYYINAKNNIFATLGIGTGYPIYTGTASYVTQASGTYLNYNDYYSSDINVGYVNGAITSLSALRTATGQDVNSININPNFISASNLKLTSYSGFECPKLNEVSVDINNYIRNFSTYMGAYQKDPSNKDAGLVSFVGLSSATSVGTYPIRVVVCNFGFDSIKTATISGKINNVSFAPISYMPSTPLAYGSMDTVTLGMFSFITGINTINAEITMLSDTIHFNDSIKSSRYMCPFIMGGEYVIGSSPAADYPTIDSLFANVIRCGVNANITLKMESGTYTGSWDLSNLSSLMGNYSLTITSVAKNRDSVIFKVNSGVLLTLNNTQNFRAKNVTLDAINGTYAVQFTGTASNITFDSCKILSNPTSTTNSYAGIYKASSSGLLNGFTLKNCLIDGGYYGVYLYANSTVSEYIQHSTIDSNIFTNQYYYGLYTYYMNSISTSYNKVTPRAVNQGTTWYGMYMYYTRNGGNIIGNRVYANNSGITSTLNGLYTLYIDTALVANNEIILNSSASTTNGLYIDYPRNVNYLHNSVLVTGTSSTCRALYWYVYGSDSYDATMKNNIFVCNGGSTAYAVYLAGTYSSSYAYNYRINYNNYYSSGSLGYVSSSVQATLANWKSVVVSDINSTNILPNFINSTINLELADYSPFIIARNNLVLSDINGVNRTFLTTKGAYSLPLFEGYDLSLEKFINPIEINDIKCISDFASVDILIKNIGTKDFYFDTNSIKLHLDVVGPVVYQLDTIIKLGSLLSSTKDTFNLTNLLPVSVSGTYSITVYMQSLVDTLYKNDTLRTVYHVNKIQLPYDIDFSIVPSEVIIKQVAGIVNWGVETGTGTNPSISPVYGTGRLSFGSSTGIGSISQVILNGLDLKGTKDPKMEFWYAHDASSTNSDFIVIKVSTDGGYSTQTLKTIQRYNASYTTPGWARYEVDLSAYKQANCLSLIIEGNSFGGANQNIDRIRIASAQDIAVSLIAPKENDLVACDLQNKTLKVVLENTTSQVIDLDKDTAHIVLEVSGAKSQTYNYTRTGKLAGLEKDTIEITNGLDLTMRGIYNFKAYIEAIDTLRNNDTSKASLLINPDIILRSISGVDAVNCKKMGDTVYVGMRIVNAGNLFVEQIPLELQIKGITLLNENGIFNLQPGDSVDYIFTQPYYVPVVSEVQPYYKVKVMTRLACDPDTTNNVKEITACVEIPEVIDLGIKSINNPTTACDSGYHKIYVSVTLENKGNQDIDNATIHVKVDSAGVTKADYSETTGTILKEDTLMYVFTQGYIVPNFTGNYKVKVYIDSIPKDTNMINDTMGVNTCAIYNEVSVKERVEESIILGQNIPNPAKMKTRIPYEIPQRGEIIFKITTTHGQVIYCKAIESASGKQEIEWDIEHLSRGIYYYSMEYKGHRIVKKMTIQK